MNSVKWSTVRNNNTIVGYQTTINGRTVTIERIDAIGVGICYQVNLSRFIFETLAGAKNYVSKVGAY